MGSRPNFAPWCAGISIPSASLPYRVQLSRGRLEVSFGSVEELAQTMLTLARIFESQGDAFVEAYEPERPVVGPENGRELRVMFEELEAMEVEQMALGSFRER